MRLKVEFEKRADGDIIMRCTREDGSITWQRNNGARASFFVIHDLTHLAVERTLKRRDGFFGLIAQGWDVEDTEGKGPRGELPPTTVEIENLVGLFDRERAGGPGVQWTSDEFNSAAAEYAKMHDRLAPAPLTEDQLSAIRNDLRELHGEWRETKPGNTMQTFFSSDQTSGIR